MTVFEVLPWITTITAAPILLVASVVSRGSLAGGVRLSLRAALLLIGLTLLSVVTLSAAWTLPEEGWVIALQAFVIIVNVATIALTARHWSDDKARRERAAAENATGA